LFLVVCAAGCIGDGGPTPGPGNPGTPDARPASDAQVLIDARPMVDAAPFKCREPITAGLDNGHHNPGQNCADSCHNHGFYMSGTLYASASGGAPVIGASITFVDATGATGDMVSGTNGNFWWTLPVTFPVAIIASSCPNMAPMTAKLNTAADGGCNQAGCHVAGGTGRVHLP
jgi:hypothetical protein